MSKAKFLQLKTMDRYEMESTVIRNEKTRTIAFVRGNFLKFEMPHVSCGVDSFGLCNLLKIFGWLCTFVNSCSVR